MVRKSLNKIKKKLKSMDFRLMETEESEDWYTLNLQKDQTSYILRVPRTEKFPSHLLYKEVTGEDIEEKLQKLE